MKIISGGLPEGDIWRTLVLLSPGALPGTAVRLGEALARGHGGELIIAVLLLSADADRIAQAQGTVNAARAACRDDVPVYSVIVEASQPRLVASKLVRQTAVDLAILQAGDPTHYRPDRFRCSVAVVYENEPPADGEESKPSFEHILVPTSAGPNTAHALRLLLALTPDSTITSVYIASDVGGTNEEALGRSRLRQMLNFVDAGKRVANKVVTADSVPEGIVEESLKDYDLIVLGATRLNPLDRALFGDVPQAVTELSQKAVVIVYHNLTGVDSLLSALAWRLQNIVPRIDLSQRTQVYVRVRRGARPDIDFFVLIGLSALIASLGLLLNSPAVVIGAMLVAPLMTPIVGIGLAIVLGDVRFLRLALGTTLRGALLGLVLGGLAGIVQISEPLTTEVLSRTQPSLVDLGVALFAGIAGAYAISHSDAAAALPGVAISAALVPPLAAAGVSLITGHYYESGGALLLFSTNFVAISSAAAFVFLVLGFRPTPGRKQRQTMQIRSGRIAMGMLGLVSVLLVVSTYPLAQEERARTRVQQVVEEAVDSETQATLVDLVIAGNLLRYQEKLELGITVQSVYQIPHATVVALQERIGAELQREVGLTLRVIRVTELDPVVPPTQTPTTIATPTSTPGPSPTATRTATPSPFVSPTGTEPVAATATATLGPTEPPSPTSTATPSPTPLPQAAVVIYPYGLNVRANPDAASTLLAFLDAGSEVILMDGQEMVDGLH